jgi:hypothetical protein
MDCPNPNGVLALAGQPLGEHLKPLPCEALCSASLPVPEPLARSNRREASLGISLSCPTKARHLPPPYNRVLCHFAKTENCTSPRMLE